MQRGAALLRLSVDSVNVISMNKGQTEEQTVNKLVEALKAV